MVETPMFLVNIRDLTPADAFSMLILREEAVEEPLMGPLSRFQGPKAHQGAGQGPCPHRWDSYRQVPFLIFSTASGRGLPCRSKLAIRSAMFWAWVSSLDLAADSL